MRHDYQRSESFRATAMLAVAGGFLDAYTYLCRGQVFANAQTGNMVLLAIRLAEGSWAQAFHYLMPILAFALGILWRRWCAGTAATPDGSTGVTRCCWWRWRFWWRWHWHRWGSGTAW